MHHLSATEIRQLISENKLSPTEVVQDSLRRIEQHNPAINAVVTLNEAALADAGRLEAEVRNGGTAGPLYGVPVGIKDVTEVGGLRTTFGSRLFADHVPSEDALIVQRLRAAGAIIIGKTNTPEFAAGGHTWNDVFGVTRNPWNFKLSPGGSTGGGAAALAAGMVALADGTDLGGSLRIPASFCGVAGLRPSPGLVPTCPSPNPWDRLSVHGPLARTVEDLALMLQAVCGPDSRSPLFQPSSGRDFVAAVRGAGSRQIRAAYCPDISGIGVDAHLERLCREAALSTPAANAVVEEIDLDLSFARPAFITLRGKWFVAHLADHLDRLDDFGVNVANNLKSGLAITGADLGAAEKARTRLWSIFTDLFQKYDLLLSPCMAVPPFPAEQNYPETVAGQKMQTYVDWIAPTFVLSLTGLPVASVPCGLDRNGLPVGLQIVGPRFGEEAVLAFAKQIEDQNPIGSPEL